MKKQFSLYLTLVFLVTVTLNHVAFSSEINSKDIPSKLHSTDEDDNQEITYDSEEEYRAHQKVSNRFFSTFTLKDNLRIAIDKFKNEIKNYRKKSNLELSEISLDNASSRSRILLFKELTANAGALKVIIPFKFHNKQFSIILNPSLCQSDNGIISTIGTYADIYNILSSYKSKTQEIIAGKLLKARQAINPYNPNILTPCLSINGQNLDLEILNILLDFEVARRLQGINQENEQIIKQLLEFLDDVMDMAETEFYSNSNSYYRGERTDWEGNSEEEKREYLKPYQSSLNSLKQASINFSDLISNNKLNLANKLNSQKNKNDKTKIDSINKNKNDLDEVPIASAIVKILELAINHSEKYPLEIFFDAPKTFTVGSATFKHGDWNVFEGAPSEKHRKKATKRIIDAQKTKNSTMEEIHQEYLRVFGGSSESEGESYEDK